MARIRHCVPEYLPELFESRGMLLSSRTVLGTCLKGSVELLEVLFFLA